MPELGSASGVPTNPGAEAFGLAQLLRVGETVESIRALIGSSPERRPTLRAFDLLCLRLPANPERQQKRLKLRKRCDASALSPLLRDEIALLLEAGRSHKEILAKVPVGPGAVQRVSKQVGGSYRKPRGRGRRFAPAAWQQIRAAVKSGRTGRDIEREFQIDHGSVVKARREQGDVEDRRYRRKYTVAQIQRAEELLRAGKAWRVVAPLVGLSLSCLMKRLRYRKYADKGATRVHHRGGLSRE
jgi:hypothetical protein